MTLLSSDIIISRYVKFDKKKSRNVLTLSMESGIINLVT
nr:MAG TPA: hypothetical protein [Caudoviricetes sp.]